MNRLSNYKYRKFLDNFLNFLILLVCVSALSVTLLPLFYYSFEWLRDHYSKLSKVFYFLFLLFNLFKYLNHILINSAKDRRLFIRTIVYTSYTLIFPIQFIVSDGINQSLNLITLSLLTVFGFVELSKIILTLDKRYTRLFYNSLNGIQIFVFSFALTIAVGTLLLLTPKASIQGLSFIDAFFTAVSATCVTGLTVVSTQHDLTTLGQLIVLLLFQIGGLGTMTFAIGLSGLFNEGMSLNSKALISNIFDSENLSNIKRILRNTFIFSFSIETFGAIYFFYTMPAVPNETFGSRIFYSIFHSISAFCNAGFSLTDSSVSSAEWSNSFSLLGMTSLLIIVGGLGFPVLLNLFDYFRKKTSLTLHTKVVLLYSGIFLITGAVLVFFLESNGLFKGESFDYKILNSIFTSVTTRTAGFNSFDFGSLNDATLFFLSGLMFIGGAPMSTAGGLKATTFAIAFSHLYGRVRKYKSPVMFKKSLSEKNISSSLNVISLSLVAAFIGVFLITVIDQEFEFIQVFFEVFSALGTVGLSAGITESLSPYSKLILAALMFVGRVNILVFFDSIIRDSKKTRVKYLKEDIIL